MKRILSAIGLISILTCIGFVFHIASQKINNSLSDIGAENVCIAEQVADGVPRSDVECN